MKKVTDDEFIRSWKQWKSATKVAGKLGMSVRGVMLRRRRIEQKTGVGLVADDARGQIVAPPHHGRKHFELMNGIMIVGSDAHYWPGEVSTAHRAMVHLTKELKPSLVVMNGDAFDGARISRFPSIGWQDVPEVEDELLAVEERLNELADAANHHNLYWPLGNHDMRYESTIANRIPEFRRVNKEAFSLKTRFPDWQACWALWVNDNTVIKHRWKGGIHAGHNNTRDSGMHLFTGHDHMLKVSEWCDYKGIRYGVQTGFLARVGGPQFVDYTEDNPVQWSSGFVVATYWKGVLLQPETCRVLDEEEGLVQFRGEVFKV